MKLLLIVVLVVALASLLYLGLQAFLVDRARSPGLWRVRTITRDDGALVVMVVRGRESSRTVRELPADLDPIELASELHLARDEARMLAEELNRSD